MKKKMIAMILVGCLCITACQSTKSNTGTEERKAQTENITSTPMATPEPTVDPVAAEEAVINTFYNTMYEVRNDFAKYKYTTVSQEVKKLKKPFLAFKRQKKIQTGNYQNYFKRMTNSSVFKYINREFIRSPKKKFDKNKFKQNAYALILRNCLEMLLKEKMPIANKHNRSMIKQLNRHYPAGRNKKKSINLLKAFMRTGLNCYDDYLKDYPGGAMHGFIPRKKIKAKTAKEAWIHPRINIAESGDRREFQIYFWAMPVNFRNAESNFTFLSGDKKIKTRKPDLKDGIVKIRNAFIFNETELFDSEVGAKKNASYKKVKNLFEKNKKITVKIGDTVVKVYNKKERKMMREYFMICDIILELYS